MSEKSEIVFMQVRLLRLASEEWHTTIQKVSRLFEKYGILKFIEDCYGVFHTEGDEAVFDEIKVVLDHKGLIFMQKLSDGMLLYHGSYMVVDTPDLAKCAARKDFGKGFYLTTSKKQAEDFVRASIKKAIAQGLITEDQNFGYVSVFKYHEKDGISKFAYEDADADWLHCIVGHRKKNTFSAIVDSMRDYDIVAGKIADDRTNVTITTYLVGGYGAIGSESADKACISQLIPERLKDQYCFRTNEAFECISFEESEKIWIS